MTEEVQTDGLEPGSYFEAMRAARDKIEELQRNNAEKDEALRSARNALVNTCAFYNTVVAIIDKALSHSSETSND